MKLVSTGDEEIDELLVQDLDSGAALIQRFHGRTDNANLTDIWDVLAAGRTQSFRILPPGGCRTAAPTAS